MAEPAPVHRYLLESEAAAYLGVLPKEVRRLPGLLGCQIGPRTVRYDSFDLRAYGLRMPPPTDAAAMVRFIRGRVADNAGDGGRIYFMRCQEIIKIGWSRQPVVRHLRLRSIIPFDLELLGSIQGSCAAEKEIHKRLAPLRYGHLQEWFTPSTALVEAIKELCDG
jgi:hypothetical protein